MQRLRLATKPTWIVIAVIATAGFAAPALAQCIDGTPPPCATARAAPVTRSRPAAERARRFLLLPFRNVTRRADQEWLVAGAPDMLATALGNFSDLFVVPEQSIAAARRRLALPHESLDAMQLKRLAAETDGWTAVTGSVFAIGPTLRVSVEALDVETSQVLVRGETEVPSDTDVRVAFNRLSARLLEPAGLPPSTPDIGALTTRSVDAYRAYARGIQFWGAGEFRDAKTAFAQAVRLDSTFSLAWARLALSAAGWNSEGMRDPATLIALQQAVRGADRLPARQRAQVSVLNAMFQGRFWLARRLTDSLVATDADDLDSRELLANIEMFFPMLDTTSTEPRPGWSMNRAMKVARDVLDRDPGRRYLHRVIVDGYARAAGLGSGTFGAYRREGGNVLMLYGQPFDATFVAVLRDSVEFMPWAEWSRLPLPEQARIRRRSADAGMQWVERWLVAGPRDAAAHFAASELAELRDDLPRALREAIIADSLGLQEVTGTGPSRRLYLHGRLGQFTAAASIADSLLRSGLYSKAPSTNDIARGLNFAAATFLLTKRWARAAALADTISLWRRAAATCGNLEYVLGLNVPLRERNAIMDTVVRHFVAAGSVPTLSPCLETLARSIAFDSMTRRRTTAGAVLLALADSLQRAGNDLVAYRAARSVFYVDTARRSTLASRPWFVERSRKLAQGVHFTPAGATIEGDSAIFGFRHTGATPLLFESPGLVRTWYLSIDVAVRNSTDTISVTIDLPHTAPWEGQEREGTLAEFVASVTAPRAYALPVRQTLPDASPTVRLIADTIRVVLRGPIVAELKRLRPETALFYSLPCVGVTDGLCGFNRVPIEYR